MHPLFIKCLYVICDWLHIKGACRSRWVLGLLMGRCLSPRDPLRSTPWCTVELPSNGPFRHCCGVSVFMLLQPAQVQWPAGERAQRMENPGFICYSYIC